MHKIVWTDEAIEHLEAIASYISAYDLVVAEKLGRRLIKLADSLDESPNRGCGVGEGPREIAIVPPYVSRYRVEGEQL